MAEAKAHIVYPATVEHRMAEIVNLRMARKRAARGKAANLAAENRLAHGASKKERADANADRETVSNTLDRHRIEPGDRR